MRTLLTAICLFCLFLFPCAGHAEQRVFLDTDAPRYENKLYGFSFTLPPGQWDAMETADGEGIIIHDGVEGDPDNTSIHAYARDGYADASLQALLNEEAKGYREILKEEISPNNDWFALTAEGIQGNYVFIKYFLKGDKANILVISAPKEQKASFDMVVSSVVNSFKPGFGK